MNILDFIGFEAVIVGNANDVGRLLATKRIGGVDEALRFIEGNRE